MLTESKENTELNVPVLSVIEIANRVRTFWTPCRELTLHRFPVEQRQEAAQAWIDEAYRRTVNDLFARSILSPFDNCPVS
jgi:hypothetical protein